MFTTVAGFTSFGARTALMATLAALALGRASAEDVVHFVVPGDAAAPSTLSITEPDAVRPSAEPTLSVVSQPSAAPLDLATLANFAQETAEEIAGEQIEGDTPRFRPITQVTIDAAFPPGALPGDPGAQPEGYVVSPPLQFGDARLWGGWAEVDFQWSCTALCHRPLYFEQVNLERYGYTISPLLQPAISGAHFFATIPTLPYKLVAQPPRECVYTLGYYRAGSRAPRRWHHVNWDPTAATVEGLLVTGLVFLIP